MIISDFAIKRPMITVVTMVALVVFGLFALWRLQTDEFPDIQQPVVLTPQLADLANHLLAGRGQMQRMQSAVVGVAATFDVATVL